MTESVEGLLQRAAAARREERLAEARRDLVRAVELCRRSGPTRELIRALGALGHVELDLGRVDEARGLYEEAVALGREEGDPQLLAHAVRHLDVHRHGRPELAEPCYREALSLYRDRERPPPLDLANAVRPLAILQEARGEAEEARRLWAEARALYASVGVEEGVAECSDALARLGP